MALTRSSLEFSVGSGAGRREVGQCLPGRQEGGRPAEPGGVGIPAGETAERAVGLLGVLVTLA